MLNLHHLAYNKRALQVASLAAAIAIVLFVVVQMLGSDAVALWAVVGYVITMSIPLGVGIYTYLRRTK